MASSVSRKSYRVVVIGAGNSAGYFVRDLLNLNSSLKGHIAVVGSENYVPYERYAGHFSSKKKTTTFLFAVLRPALSKGFLLVTAGKEN